MTIKSLLRISPLAITLALLGCASRDDGVSQGVDDLTPDEAAAGAAWTGEEEHASEDVGAAAMPEDPVTTPAEDSASFLEPEALVDADGQPIAEIDPADLQEIKTCHRANGYRSGRRFTICITHIDGTFQHSGIRSLEFT